MTTCRECKEPINVGATRCHHCTAPQNWLRFLGNGAVLAGLVLTLVSIWAAQPIKELIEPKRANITVSILEGDFLHTTFMLSNTGNRPAGLAQIDIESKLKNGNATWLLRSELDKKLIEPGKAYVVNAANGSAIPAAVPHEVRAMLYGKDAGKENCNLVVQYVQMNGTKEYLYYPFLCNPVEIDSEPIFK